MQISDVEMAKKLAEAVDRLGGCSYFVGDTFVTLLWATRVRTSTLKFTV